MEIDLLEIWANMPLLVRGVVAALTLQALASIYVLIDRLILLGVSSARSRKFAIEGGAMLANNELEAALTVAKKHDKSHLASFIETGISVFLARRKDGHTREKAAEFTQRALERKGENLSESLNRGLNVLASTGSTAPFIGLLGTVLGIIETFRGLAETGIQGTAEYSDKVMSGIYEALVATAVGLLVAIPAVIAYNFFMRRVKALLSEADAVTNMVHALLEGQGGRRD